MSGALVTAARIRDDGVNPTPVVADADGLFILRRLERGQYLVTASHPGFASNASATCDLRGDATSPVVLRFPGGGDLSVLVADAQGRAVSDVVIDLKLDTDSAGSDVRSLVTDSSGRAVIRSLPASFISSLIATHPDYVTSEKLWIPLPAVDYELRLDRCLDLTVVLEPMPDTTASAATRVWLMQAAPAAVAPPPDTFRTVTSAQLEADRAVFSFLEPGWYKGAAMCGGTYAESDAVQLTPTDKAGRVVRIAWSGGGMIRGHVTDKTTGRGLAGVSVRAEPASAPPVSVGPRLTTTSPDGAYELTALPACAVLVSAVLTPYPQADRIIRVQPRSTSTVDLVLSGERGSLVGTITMNGSPVKGALIVLLDTDGAGGDRPQAESESGPDGKYQLTQLVPGDYILSVEAPAGQNDRTMRRTCEVKVSDTSSVRDFAFREPVTINGTVTLGGQSAGEKYRSGSLLIAPKDGGETVAPELSNEGTFRAELQPGDYSVILDDRPARQITIPPSSRPYQLTLSY